MLLTGYINEKIFILNNQSLTPVKTFTQTGRFSIVVLLSAIAFCIVMLFVTGFDEPVHIVVLGFVIIIMILCLLIFYKLTITVDDTHLSFKMGIGLIKKSYPLSVIESCTPVRNSPLWGVGIRMTPAGWLYNVSGLSAIELTFRNSRKKVRIGSDKPEEIAGMVTQKTTGVQPGSFYEKSGNQGIYITVIVVAAAIVIPFLIVLSGRRETGISFSDTAMTISGMYGLAVSHGDIIHADTLTVLPEIKARTNGFAAGKILKGHFKLRDESKVMLFITEGVPPYILIKTKTLVIYMNFEIPAKTREVFKKIKDKR